MTRAEMLARSEEALRRADATMQDLAPLRQYFGGVPSGDVIALLAAQVRLGQAWIQLAEAVDP